MRTKNEELPHGTNASYTLGFVLSIALTLFAFWVAPLFGAFTYSVFIAAALAQLFVQLFFFLHFGRGADAGKNITIAVFTVVIIGIVVIGTIWIMNNLAHLHMMPPTTTDLYTNGQVAPQNELK